MKPIYMSTTNKTVTMEDVMKEKIRDLIKYYKARIEIYTAAISHPANAQFKSKYKVLKNRMAAVVSDLENIL